MLLLVGAFFSSPLTLIFLSILYRLVLLKPTFRKRGLPGDSWASLYGPHGVKWAVYWRPSLPTGSHWMSHESSPAVPMGSMAWPSTASRQATGLAFMGQPGPWAKTSLFNLQVILNIDFKYISTCLPLWCIQVWSHKEVGPQSTKSELRSPIDV